MLRVFQWKVEAGVSWREGWSGVGGGEIGSEHEMLGRGAHDGSRSHGAARPERGKEGESIRDLTADVTERTSLLRRHGAGGSQWRGSRSGASIVDVTALTWRREVL